jgi:hypothetical protein
MTTKSFRGMIADLATDTISLHTNTGSTGYRITKFQLMAQKPSGENQESVVKVFSIPPRAVSDGAGGTLDAVNDRVDFSDNTLLAAAYLESAADAKTESQIQTIIFDNMKFNQDIYVTHKDGDTGANVNYYIELEQVTLALDENTVATLKDIRNITQ